MTEFELGWVAGLLEGEGCFHGGTRTKVTLQMTDRDTVERLASLVEGASEIWTITPKGDRAGNRIMYAVAISGYAAIRLMELVFPHMSRRRAAKIREIISSWTPQRREYRLPPVCHPERPHHSNGLCKRCANIKWRRDHGEKAREPRKKPWAAHGLARSVWYRRGLHREQVIENGSQLSERNTA